MATTITPIAYSDTPYSKKFLLEGDGAEGVFPIDDGTGNPLTSFAAALHAGPLRDTLMRAVPTALAEFNINAGTRGDEIRIYDIPANLADSFHAPATPRNIYWKNGATQAVAGLSCTLPAVGEGGMRSIIEIRLNHSTQG